MKLSVVFSALLFLSLAFSAQSANANELRAHIRLYAQMWKRSTDPSEIMNAKAIGGTQFIEVDLDETPEGQAARMEFSEDELTAKGLFVLKVPNAPELPYVITQFSIYHPERGLIAECSNYDSIQYEKAIGVGGCSGIIDGVQFGISLIKPKQ